MQRLLPLKIWLVFFVLVAGSLLASAALTHPGALNSSVTVLRGDNKQPLPDAIVTIVPLNQQNRNGGAVTGVTDLKGSYKFNLSEPVIIRITHIGFFTITDTLLSAENKEYSMAVSAQNLNDVVVTGIENSTSRQSMYDVKIINQDMIRAEGANNLRDILQTQMGIDMGQDPVFGSYLSINGVSGEGIKLMVDGVPIVGRLDGKIDLSEIDLNNVDHIEIIQGPLSVIYGTDAMGGVINIITKDYQAHKINISLKGYYESVGQYNVELNAAFAFKRNQIFLSGGRNFFNGYSSIDTVARVKDWLPREQYFADAKYVYTGNKIRVTADGNFFRELMIDRGAPELGIVQSPDSVPSFTYVGYDTHYLTYRMRGSVMLTYKPKAGQQLDVLAAYSGFIRYTNVYEKDLVTLQQHIVNDTTDPSQQDTNRYHQMEVRATYLLPAWKNRLNFLFGADVNQGYLISGPYDGGNHQIGDYAAFASMKITVLEGFDIQPALRYAYNTLFTTPLIPSLNIRYNYKDKILVRLSYGRGYRAPTLDELYLIFYDSNHNLVGNPKLKPEDGQNLNSSFDYTQRAGKHTIDYMVSGFFNYIKNEIDWASYGPGSVDTPNTYINLPYDITYGGNVTLAYRWKGLHASACGQLTGYDMITDTVSSHHVKMLSPDFVFNAGYMIPKALIGINFTYKYVGEKPAFSLNRSFQTGTISPYNLLNASLTRNFWKDRIQLTIGGKNLLGVKQINTSGVTGVGHNIGGDESIAWGRTFFASLVLNYSK